MEHKNNTIYIYIYILRYLFLFKLYILVINIMPFILICKKEIVRA